MLKVDLARRVAVRRVGRAGVGRALAERRQGREGFCTVTNNQESDSAESPTARVRLTPVQAEFGRDARPINGNAGPRSHASAGSHLFRMTKTLTLRQTWHSRRLDTRAHLGASCPGHADPGQFPIGCPRNPNREPGTCSSATTVGLHPPAGTHNAM